VRSQLHARACHASTSMLADTHSVICAVVLHWDAAADCRVQPYLRLCVQLASAASGVRLVPSMPCQHLDSTHHYAVRGERQP
jgi:hypothetical protein